MMCHLVFVRRLSVPNLVVGAPESACAQAGDFVRQLYCGVRVCVALFYVWSRRALEPTAFPPIGRPVRVVIQCSSIDAI